ncbi:MAG: hypothetical protein Q9219_003883 [cf. Caloplaca sp. 3 TL-2023]
MAALHSALQSLGPTEFSTVPTEQSEIKDYLQQLFTQAQIIIDSVPPPAEAPTPARSRANTASSNPIDIADLATSSARSDPIDPANTSFQKEWSKPIKLGAKENPLGMSVYKLGGKDGKGAWFARRSVHEGMGFRKWKLGLQVEFPESMEVQGGPGEGNIRGIGGERRVEKVVVDGVGTIEVYHLSAQFPGPTTPRDFVTMLVTSSTAIDRSTSTSEPIVSNGPRHFMVISKPCIHPGCPPRDGFVRGQYESVEFIREIPIKPVRSSSTTNLLQQMQRPGSDTKESGVAAAVVENAQRTLDKGGSGDQMLANMDADGYSPLAKHALVQEGRKRGKTISFAESRGPRAKGEAMDTPHDELSDPAEQNPVEWIMITRSDPGGSVPRFMVERGTPSGIVSDASKFLDWACKKEHPVKDDYAEKPLETNEEAGEENPPLGAQEQHRLNGHVAGSKEVPGSTESSTTLTDENAAKSNTLSSQQVPQENIVSNMASTAITGIESYAQAIKNHLPGSGPEGIGSALTSNDPETPVKKTTKDVTLTDEAASLASTSDSFASAEDHFDDAGSTPPNSTMANAGSSPPNSTTASAKPSPSSDRQEKELAKHVQRKKTLDDKLLQRKEKEGKNVDVLTTKEEDRIRKAEEWHAREVAKQEQRYQREVTKIEAKRVKEEQKAAERKKKAEEKDEKVKLTRERDAAKAEVENLKRERDLLKDQVGALQRENTALVAKLGKLEIGRKVLGEVQAEVGNGGRSRSSSLRRTKGESMTESGVEATVLARADAT